LRDVLSTANPHNTRYGLHLRNPLYRRGVHYRLRPQYPRHMRHLLHTQSTQCTRDPSNTFAMQYHFYMH
jgi:hypothetical protein